MIHDGHTNIYAFKDKGHNLTLTLLPLPKPHNSEPGKEREKSLFMSETRVRRAISKGQPLFALLMPESNTHEGVKPMYPLTQPLLREFMDVFPNDLPPKVLPFKGIEH